MLSLLGLASVASAQTVCIDPGHPSEVGIGTQGKRSTEVGIAWQIAKALQMRLRREGIDVLLTKQSQREKVTNRRRAEIANAAHAALMIRLHCDASNGSGFAVYYPAKPGTTAGVTGPSQEVIEASKRAGGLVHSAMAKSLKGSVRDNGLKTDAQTAVGAKQGALTGSIFSQVPAVLVEMVVLTNRKDEAFILSKSGRAKMVEALAAGVLAAVKQK
ncbi:N-acetylmuramoyl-L-alanine amidase domain protein [Fimbriimonas ginsengisoli Gsoil 348]|uniref:N-acetylmuramoyl-L-alanine amidase domain protein n=1 Tax=Fimbriimonas ginsengisoli Gsoil 348 TaxID=661478 RepID=A0A068NU89_FIMGI|nr:N-acetylmuramoyl-L-alanine amidase domain protein [Fimbriimonas ginsengisoli Gsoil 348]